MIVWVKRYKAFLIGLVITFLLSQFLIYIEFILIDRNETLESFLLFVFWWIVISLPIHNVDYLRRKKRMVYGIIVLLVILAITFVSDEYFNIPDNPLSIFMIITFWMGIVYLITPAFFLKYSKFIIAVYVILFAYWTYTRLFSESFEYYQNHEKGFAFTLMMIPVPILFLLWGYEQWKWLRSLKADKAAAELAMLKTQINPHFFFNTLNNLYSLTVKHSDKAPQVILKLSDIMRYTIYEGKKESVSLQAEVDYLNNYIDLHKIRYHKKVDIQFSHDIEKEDEVAPLMFIVLLENAFKHGIESLSNNAYIIMKLMSNGENVQFFIENNFDPNEKSEEHGIGLENLKRRLDLIYPNRHKLTITEDNDIYSVNLSIEIK